MVGPEHSTAFGVASPLLRKIRAAITVTDEERYAIEMLERDGTPFLGQTQILADGAPCRGVGIVEAGWVLRSKALSDGRRQVINFALPGDILCLDALTFDRAYCDLWTIGRAVVTWRSVEEIEQLFTRFPHLAFAIRRLAVQEEAMLSERLLSVGRRSAIESVSHLLLELWHRLMLAGLAGGRAFPMPLSQEVIGDALGLSTVHVNRTLKVLERKGLIRVDRHRPRSIIVLDAPRIERLAGFKPSYLDLGSPPDLEPRGHRRANA